MTTPDDSLAEFAAAFLANYAANDMPPDVPADVPRDVPRDVPSFGLAPTQVDYPGLTREAAALLRGVDAGGVPAFITDNLRRIAVENGVEIDPRTTPAQIVATLRALSAATAFPPNDNG